MPTKHKVITLRLTEDEYNELVEAIKVSPKDTTVTGLFRRLIKLYINQALKINK